MITDESGAFMKQFIFQGLKMDNFCHFKQKSFSQCFLLTILKKSIVSQAQWRHNAITSQRQYN